MRGLGNLEGHKRLQSTENHPGYRRACIQKMTHSHCGLGDVFKSLLIWHWEKEFIRFTYLILT